MEAPAARAAPAEREPKAAGAEDYSAMTVAQLKDKLRERKLKVSGRKAELVERLQQQQEKVRVG